MVKVRWDVGRYGAAVGVGWGCEGRTKGDEEDAFMRGERVGVVGLRMRLSWGLVGSVRGRGAF